MSRKCRRYNSSLLSTIILLFLLKDGCSDNSPTTDGGNTTGNDSSSGDSCQTSGSNKDSNFIESVYELTAVNNADYSLPFITASLATVTAFVENLGKSCDVVVFLEISPNNVIYIRDGIEYRLQPGELIALVPSLYSKFIRVGFRTNESCCSKVRINFQGKV